jgi:DNA invertase Pin-like site-specific DNA recombinase
MTVIEIQRCRTIYDAVRAGREPAESLPTAVRRALFVELFAEGVSIRDIADLTRTTDYTVARILDDAEAAARDAYLDRWAA